jgi:hypothetical protein
VAFIDGKRIVLRPAQSAESSYDEVLSAAGVALAPKVK